MSKDETIAELKRQIWALDATVHNLRLKNEALQEAIAAKEDLIRAQKDYLKQIDERYTILRNHVDSLEPAIKVDGVSFYNIYQLEAAGACAVQALGADTAAQEVCAEAYQVIGVLLDDIGLMGTARANKILDNLSKARLVHNDVLPWESVKADMGKSHITNAAPQQAAPAVQFDADGFRAWVLRNLPDDTIISSGAWWANHLTLWAQRFVNAAPQQEVPATPSDEQVWAAMEAFSKNDSNSEGMRDALIASAFATPQQEVQSPMFWVRLRSDGGYEGPIHHEAIERVRKSSGDWHPLYLETAPQPAPSIEQPTNEMIEAGLRAAETHGPLLGNHQSLWHVFRDMLAAAPKQGVQELKQTPFANCRFQICDLPGQCKGEGKCHHPGAPQQEVGPYMDSTPQLHIGDSRFESWYSDYNPASKGDKQRARDAYAAGMGDPLVVAAPQQEVQEPVAWIEYARKKPSLRRLVFVKTSDKELRVSGWVAEPLSRIQPAPSIGAESGSANQSAPAELERLRDRVSRIGLDVDRAMSGHVNEQSPLGAKRLGAIAAMAAQKGGA